LGYRRLICVSMHNYTQSNQLTRGKLLVGVFLVELDEIFKSMDLAVVDTSQILFEKAFECGVYIHISITSRKMEFEQYGKHSKYPSCHFRWLHQLIPMSQASQL